MYDNPYRPHFKILPPFTHEADEAIRFKCTEDNCGDKLTSDQLFLHAYEVHNAHHIDVDTRAIALMGISFGRG